MRSLLVAAAGAGLVLTLAGCGGGADAAPVAAPATSSPVPSSPSASPSASPTADPASLTHELNLRALKVGCADVSEALAYVDRGQLELGQTVAKQAVTVLQGVDKTDNDVAVDSTGLVFDLSFTQFTPVRASFFDDTRKDYGVICLTKRGFPKS